MVALAELRRRASHPCRHHPCRRANCRPDRCRDHPTATDAAAPSPAIAAARSVRPPPPFHRRIFHHRICRRRTYRRPAFRCRICRRQTFRHRTCHGCATVAVARVICQLARTSVIAGCPSPLWPSPPLPRTMPSPRRLSLSPDPPSRLRSSTVLHRAGEFARAADHFRRDACRCRNDWRRRCRFFDCSGRCPPDSGSCGPDRSSAGRHRPDRQIGHAGSPTANRHRRSTTRCQTAAPTSANLAGRRFRRPRLLPLPPLPLLLPDRLPWFVTPSIQFARFTPSLRLRPSWERIAAARSLDEPPDDEVLAMEPRVDGRKSARLLLDERPSDCTLPSERPTDELPSDEPRFMLRSEPVEPSHHRRRRHH